MEISPLDTLQNMLFCWGIITRIVTRFVAATGLIGLRDCFAAGSKTQCKGLCQHMEMTYENTQTIEIPFPMVFPGQQTLSWYGV